MKGLTAKLGKLAMSAILAFSVAVPYVPAAYAETDFTVSESATATASSSEGATATEEAASAGSVAASEETSKPESSAANASAAEGSSDAGSQKAAQTADSSAAANANGQATADAAASAESTLAVDTQARSFQYIYIAYPEILPGAQQTIGFGTENDSDALATATLTLEDDYDNLSTVTSTGITENFAAFVFGENLAEGAYKLASIQYTLQNDETQYVVDLSNYSYFFDVTEYAEMESEGNTTAYYADEDGNAVQAGSIEEAAAMACGGDAAALTSSSSSSKDGICNIALDAGHGGADPGACANGLQEADLTMKIVTACKAKLDAAGYNTIMVRTQDGNYASGDYKYRVQRALDQGAQVYVSFHIDAGGGTGASVLVPSNDGSSHTAVSLELANKVMDRLAALGLKRRGLVTRTDLAVINGSKKAGIPGILIEHGFIDNASDCAKYFTDAGCKLLGETDADAIMAQFPLVDYSPVYDYDYYIANNPDVVQVLGKDERVVLKHFLEYGMKEGRQASANFNVQCYKANYEDLQKAFGNDLTLYYKHYIEYGQSEARNAKSYRYRIMGYSTVSAKAMASYFESKGRAYPSSVYASKGAANIQQFCETLCQQAEKEGVRADVVFAQAMLETGYLQFGGDVKAEQCNFAGLGATGGGVPGNSFANVAEGLLAQVQHLKGYASTDDLNETCVDPRFKYLSSKRGSAPTVDGLTGTWAADASYATKIKAILDDLESSSDFQLVYRLYNPITSEHLFTTDANEYNSLVKYDWKKEGAAWESLRTGTKGVYRLYNSGLGAQRKMSHHYTTDKAEADDLVKNWGWVYDNNANPIFYSAEDGSGSLKGASAVYRLYNDGLSAHHYTLSKFENDSLIAEHGWKGEDVGFYAYEQ